MIWCTLVGVVTLVVLVVIFGLGYVIGADRPLRRCPHQAPTDESGVGPLP